MARSFAPVPTSHLHENERLIRELQAADGLENYWRLYFLRRDRRYLTFIWQVVKFTIIVLAIVLLFFAAERLFGPILAPLL